MLDDGPEIVEDGEHDVIETGLLDTILSESWRVNGWVEQLNENEQELPVPYAKPVRFRPRQLCFSESTII